MDEVYVRNMELPCWIADEYFYRQDLVSIEDLIGVMESLKDDLEIWKEKYENFKQEVEDNYKFIDTKEQIGYDERTW